jgi:hypothetical protein
MFQSWKNKPQAPQANGNEERFADHSCGVGKLGVELEKVGGGHRVSIATHE